MINILGGLLAIIFAILSLLHINWAFDGISNSEMVIPSVSGEPLFEPSKFTTLLVATALLIAMLVILGQIGWVGVSIPKWIFQWGTWAVSVLFFLRAIGEFNLVGFFKKVRNTKFAYWDTRFFSPLCLFIAVIAFWLAWNKG